MAAMVLNRRTLALFTVRINAIRPDAERLWGEMTPARMLAHLTRSIEISLGEYPVKDRSLPLVRSLLRWWVFHPRRDWPEGKIKSPADWTPEPTESFTEERAKLLQAMDRFLAAAAREPGRKTVSPLFGPLTLEYWRLVHGKHIDHHLRQFGV
jgi:oxepin-CoA hydrolase / 3-oxo-5,6-dehydrosuberyl-CoA semialdehyde dehydrogenase